MLYTKLMKNMIKNTRVPCSFVLSSPKKISKKSKCAFSLPAGSEFSCIGETLACKEDCYAKKKRHIFSNVQKSLAQNWKLIRHLKNTKNDEYAILMLSGSIPGNTEIFRIFESGDFDSQWSVDIWSKVVRLRKEILFWAYTRSFDLNYAKILRNDNFLLWASTDDCNLESAKSFVKKYKNSYIKHAYGPWPHDRNIPDNSIICPVTNGKLDMNGACEVCKLCVIKGKTSKNVVFLKH